ncbi:hypothetical protein EW145_g2372 [Phellinidium pouzarii]|uniref:methionine--tRNA ligase n=1 Tax=Phellinidium pouzarii TaxID=167371 RepID=A0A4V3XDA5_9AGAM|nr:hypothetical protein EW145_g2372 [Phellinidium pouzarii]
MAQNIRFATGLLRLSSPEGEPILPKDGENNVLITSALPYCNNVPHLGNIIGSTLSADVFARYNRRFQGTRNRRTLYVCGTDEYGTATETQALKEGITAQELCDKYHLLHRSTYEWFEISFDHFGRTTTPQHTEICQEIYTNLSKNSLLEKQNKEQTYCEGCEKFLADRFVEGTCPHCGADDGRGDQCDFCGRTLDAIELINPRCLINKTHNVTRRESAHMYVRLNVVQPRTEEWIKKSWKAGGWSPNAVINSDGVLIDPRVKGGLRPSPVTRDLTWGVPVPNIEGADNQEMKGKVMYVWFDAPIGYPSITANYTNEWKKWWFDPKNVSLYQFMGKDNVYFHTIFWPSIQLGDGRDWTMLHHLSTTEYLNYEGGKFSKSHNRGVFGPAAKETGIPVSVWRYYLLSSRPETQDAMFSWAECIAANNNILLKNFGNFVNRTLSFVAKNYDGILPDGGDAGGPLSPNDENDADFVTDVNIILQQYIDALESVKLRLGLHIVMQLSSRGNGYLQSAGLGTALMDSEPVRCAQVLCRAVNLIYVLSVLVEPFMPATAAALLVQLNAPQRTVPEVIAVDILPGHVLGKPKHLFKPIKEEMAETWREQFAGSKKDIAPVDGAPVAGATPALSKRKAAAAAKAAKKDPIYSGPKSPKMSALEDRIAEQGEVVRKLKAQTPKTKEIDEEIVAAVEDLKKLKAELATAIKDLEYFIFQLVTGDRDYTFDEGRSSCIIILGTEMSVMFLRDLRQVISFLILGSFVTFVLLSAVFGDFQQHTLTGSSLDFLKKRPDFEQYVYLRTLSEKDLDFDNPHRRIILIGDIHGMKSSLDKLLEKIEYAPTSDLLIHVGDIVAKGPLSGSLDVLSFMTAHNITGVRGNHDQMVIGWRTWIELVRAQPGGKAWLDKVEQKSFKELKAYTGTAGKWWPRIPDGWELMGDHYRIARALTAEQYEYLRELPLVLHSPRLHAFIVHAGLLPIDPRRDAASSNQPLAHIPDFASAKSNGRHESHNLTRLRALQECALLADVPQNSDPWVLLNMRSVLKDKSISKDAKEGSPWALLWNAIIKRCGGFDVDLLESNDAEGVENVDARKSDKLKTSLPCNPLTIIYGHAASRGLDIRRWSKGLDSGC